jgi:hypothetical protein
MEKAQHATEKAMFKCCQPSSMSVKKWKGFRRWEFAYVETTVMMHELQDDRFAGVVVVVIRGDGALRRELPGRVFGAAAASFGERMLVP